MFHQSFLILESYLFALLHPKKTLDYLDYNISLWEGGDKLPKLTLAHSLSVSWAFAMLRAIMRLLLANIVVKIFVGFQSDNPFFNFIETDSGLLPYYFLLFSTALDVIFFPVVAFITVEMWNLILFFYGQLLNLQTDLKSRVENINTVALTSNLFLAVPFFGQILQELARYVLMYVGIRKSLGASRSLSIIILLTPLLLIVALSSVLLLVIIYTLSY